MPTYKGEKYRSFCQHFRNSLSSIYITNIKNVNKESIFKINQKMDENIECLIKAI